MKKSIVAILKDTATGLGEVLTRMIEGDAAAGSNGLVGYSFKDKDGNVILPQLNEEGAIVVAQDAGTTLRAVGKLLEGSQAQDTQAKVIGIALSVDPANAIMYTKQNFMASCYAEVEYEMQLIVDEGLGGEAITSLGYGLTSDVNANVKGALMIDKFEVPAGATTAELRLMATPYENGNQLDDIRAWMSVNEIA